MAHKNTAPHPPLYRSSTLVVALLLLACCAAAWLVCAEAPSVSGATWQDTNQDGVHDADEPGTADALIVLSDPLGEIIAWTLSDEDGHYSLAAPSAGAYCVTFRNIGYLTGLTPSYVAVDLSSGSQTVDFPCASYLPGCHPALGGMIYQDDDGDGQLDDGEDTLSEIPVRLYTLDGDLGGVTLTDKDGDFSVEMYDMVPGYVVLDPPKALCGGSTPLYWASDFSGCYAGSAAVGLVPTGCGPSAAALTDASPSMLPPEPGILSGTVCMADSGAPISGVEIALYAEDGALADTAVSDAQGQFSFVDLEQYTTFHVVQEPITGLEPTTSLRWGIATTSRCKIDLRLPQRPSADVAYQAWCPIVFGQ